MVGKTASIFVSLLLLLVFSSMDSGIVGGRITEFAAAPPLIPLDITIYQMDHGLSVNSIYSILVNGHPTSPFQAKKGLRQGDPLSPFLIALGMEFLSRCMSQLKQTPDFNFHPKCERLNITHLMFADDLLFFSREDVVSVQLLLAAFQKFSSASGLEANLIKSNI
ncbi:uncharacterized protein [Spinacia oleracea]|uniref:Reverse transcriptase domain-containing protein n=1 Tax=Spinacia oleracea TaxID=3562 RepID=A0ABM3RP46_SPIOL|nr:uncharacterized protein LOC130471360 [Spinacia oleracea]